MALNPEAIGRSTAPVDHHHTWKDVVLYALGVGCKRDTELPFLYEKHGPRVMPSWAVIPAYTVLPTLLELSGGDYKGVVHVRQDVRLHKPFEPEGTLRTVGKVKGIYDMKRFGQAVFVTETRDASGALVCETDWGILFRFDGGFGGERPPAEPRVKAPDAAPIFEVTERIPEEQALLYRLTGDLNPLHADPDVAKEVGFEKPILHGLATLGYVTRTVVREVCGGDPTRVRAMGGQFRKPLTPGETLVVTGYRDQDRIVLRAAVDTRPDEYVLTNAYVDVV